MSGYYLTEGSSSSGGSGYPNRFQWFNQWFENTFGRIVGDGFGVRNWFGPCEEGDWSEIYEIKDYWIIALLHPLSFLVGIYLLTTNNLALGVMACVFPVAIFGVFAITQINPKIMMEFISAKYIKEQLKLPILLVSLWVVSSIILHTLMPQQLIIPTVPTILDQILNFYIPIINTPIIETVIFVAFVASFAVYIGIIPSLSFISIAVGIFHFIIFKGDQINILLSILLWFFLLAIVLKYKNSFPAIFGHSLANTLAIIVNGLIK